MQPGFIIQVLETEHLLWVAADTLYDFTLGEEITLLATVTGESIPSPINEDFIPALSLFDTLQ